MGAMPERVCVVDDDQSIHRGLRRLFKSAGYAAEMFASAEDYLARETFTGSICLVLDVRMPGLNGLGLQQALETRGPAIAPAAVRRRSAAPPGESANRDSSSRRTVTRRGAPESSAHATGSRRCNPAATPASAASA